MTSRKFGLTLVLLFILFFGLISLPNFKFDIGDRTINFNLVDRAFKKVNSSLGNFNKSYGLYPTHQVSTLITYSSENLNEEEKTNLLHNLITTVQRRAEIAGIYDVKIWGSNNGNDFKLNFEFPEYYTNPSKYASWLSAKGEVSFMSSSQENPRILSLVDRSIEGAIVTDYLDTFQTHLSFKFNEASLSELNNAFNENTQGRYFLMNIDETPAYYIVEYDNFVDTNPLNVRALPTQLVELNNTKERNDYINITKSYFSSYPIEETITTEDNVKIIPPVYKAESSTLIASTFILSIILLSLAFLQRYKVKGFISYLLIIASFLTLFVSIMKLLSLNLSISLLLGVIFSTILVSSLVWYLLSVSESIANRDRIRIRDTSIFIFFIASLIYKLSPSLGLATDFIGIILISSIVLFILSIFNIKVALNYYNQKIGVNFPNLKIINRKK